MRFAILSSLALAATLSTRTAAQNAGITLNNAVDGFVEVPYSPQVVPQSGITVEAWVTYDDATLGTGWRFPTVVRQNRNAGQESFFLRVEANNTNNTAIRWLVTANSTVTVDWAFAPGQLLTWTHLAGTWDGQTARLFVNGVEVGSGSGTGPLNDQGDVLRIGKGSDIATPIEVWNGSIDEVRLWPFARTAAEIQSTMSLELIAMPGQVSTWNLNNHTFDTSSGRNATIGGSVAYTSSAPALATRAFPGANAGASTPGCRGPLVAAATALPQVGNAGFALRSYHGVAGNATICLVGTAAAPTPLNLLGIAIWVDVTSLLGGFPTAVDPLGTARLDLPVPATIPTGGTLVAQFVGIDPCGPQGLAASDTIALAIVR